MQKKIAEENNRVEFLEKDGNYVFAIFFIPEHRKELRSIETVEINILYDIKDKGIHFFANNTEYFFDKYSEEISQIEVKSFGYFLEKFLSLIFVDTTRIIEHILSDTEEIKKEFLRNSDTYKIIRHLTNNQINISSLKLMVSNQNKLIELINDFMTKNQQNSLNYRKNYLIDELNYATEFSDTLMTSINTKFQVQSSDDLYRFTKLSFITFVATLFLTALLVYMESTSNHGTNIFYFSLVGMLLIAFGVIIFFRQRK